MFRDNDKSNFLIGNAFFKESMISTISLQPLLKGSHFLLFFPSQFIIIIIVIVLQVKPNSSPITYASKCRSQILNFNSKL